MLTITETKKVELNTPDDIARHLEGVFAEMAEGSGYKAGEAVNIANRASLHPDLAIGDVGVMLCDLPRQPWSWVLVYAKGGSPIAIQVPTDILAKREAESAGQ
ncbi:hypothetical protein [Methylorubrum zatmanii]|uniref:Uncharacterized protein n=1 Tax=Methylorubrum zatmanii TaxID=29429 RepID=A0ABW1WIH9_9HYPH|nr:hypothetical protein [Methylorubrum zatmanii]MBD8906532.1 hypothetical protein [Methylorubrum zatmanii]